MTANMDTPHTSASSSEQAAPAECTNCDAALACGMAYCPKCGQSTRVARITLREIGDEFMHVLVHVDRSALSLIRQLLTKPGIVAAEYIAGKRKRYFGPFGFLVVTVALASALIAITGFHAVLTPSDQADDVPNRAAAILQRHINLVYFAEVPLLAALCWIMGLRRRPRFNYAEYLVIASYTSGLHMLFFALLVIPGWFVLRSRPAIAMDLYFAYLPVWPLYFAFAFAQFLGTPRLWSAIKGFIAVIAALPATLYAVSLIANTYVKIFH